MASTPDPASDSEMFIKKLWMQFCELFPTDAACMLEILRKLEISTTHCKLCESSNVELQEECRVMFCHHCKRRVWLTAGTFFGYMKKPHAWLGAIWLLEHGAVTNACAFQKLACIAYSSSLLVFHKVSTAIAKNVPGEFPTVQWSDFCAVYARRTRETPKRLHPAADERTESDEPASWDDPLSDGVTNQYQNGRAARPENSQAPDLNEIQKSILENLTQAPADVERLCQQTGVSAGEIISNLTMLELLNLVRSAGAGSFVVNKQKPCSSSSSSDGTFSQSVVDQVLLFMGFIEFVFDRISQKYLRQYLAAYWCLTDRARWKKDAVFDACKRFGPLPYRKLVYSRSPREARFPVSS